MRMQIFVFLVLDPFFKSMVGSGHILNLIRIRVGRLLLVAYSLFKSKGCVKQTLPFVFLNNCLFFLITKIHIKMTYCIRKLNKCLKV